MGMIGTRIHALKMFCCERSERSKQETSLEHLNGTERIRQKERNKWSHCILCFFIQDYYSCVLSAFQCSPDEFSRFWFLLIPVPFAFFLSLSRSRSLSLFSACIEPSTRQQGDETNERPASSRTKKSHNFLSIQNWIHISLVEPSRAEIRNHHKLQTKPGRAFRFEATQSHIL